MSGFLEFLTENQLTIIICLLIAIFVLIMAIIVIDILSKNSNDKKEEDLEPEIDKENFKNNNDGFGMIADEDAINRIDVEAVTKNLEKTQEIEEIKYVEEDEELEKTKAKLELETLKKELAKMEEIEEPETVDTPIVEEKPSKIEPVEQEVKENELSPTQIEEPVVENTTEEQIPTMEEQVESFESSQEEHAIISVEELMEASKNITEEEIEQYEDDGNEPISIKELEALYKSVEEPVKLEIPVVEEKISFPELDIKAKPASEVYEGKTFKNSDVISPVFGLKATEESITLEHTANLDKLNEEIRKTNEFLSALKELRKNLD